MAWFTADEREQLARQHGGHCPPLPDGTHLLESRDGEWQAVVWIANGEIVDLQARFTGEAPARPYRRPPAGWRNAQRSA
jgi:hypothetical protein